MNENELRQEEISLFDLWEKLRRGWRVIFGTLCVAISAAAVSVFVISPKFEAVAIVQVGQVNGDLVEPASQAIERMKTPAFQLRTAKVVSDEKWLSDLMDSASGSSKDLSVQAVKATVSQGAGSLIELKASAESKELAAKKAEAVVAELVKVHDELAQPTISRLRNDLAIAKEKLARAEKDMEELGKLVAAASVKDDRFTQLSLMTSVRLQKEAEIFGQRQSIMALETALAAPATQSAKTIEAVFVSDKPVSPKKNLVFTLAALGGLLFGVILVFVIEVWCRMRERYSASR